MNRAAPYLLLSALVLLTSSATGGEPAGPDASGEGMAAPAAELLASLPPEQREDAFWGFDSPERTDVHFAPFNLDGVEDRDLSPASRSLGEALLAVSLSPDGVRRVGEIRDLERDVVVAEEGSLFGFATRWMRDPGRYLWAFFGEPSDDAPWGFRLEGHHLSVNVSALPGRAPASTPLFLGAQPRIVPEGMPSAGVAALGPEEELARDLYASLGEAQRYAATLPYEDDRGHMVGQVARIDPQKPLGVARTELDEVQRALLDALVDRFPALFAEPIAQARRAEIEAARDGLHFAFVASDEPPDAYYVRVSGPGVLIEIDNTTDGDHVHAVWHRPGADFGDDLLARHLEREHGVSLARSLHPHAAVEPPGRAR